MGRGFLNWVGKTGLKEKMTSWICLRIRVMTLSLIYFVFFLFLTGMVPFFLTASHAKKDVLVLHSYHRGDLWCDSIADGIEEKFEGKKNIYQLYHIYMGARFRHDPVYYSNLYELYRLKFEDMDFDLVICTDDYAFEFLMENKELLFPGIPAVFCGVIEYDRQKYDAPWLTGIMESTSVKETLDIALKLHPQTREVVVTLDMAEPAVSLKKKLDDIRPEYEKNGIRFRYLQGLTKEELITEMKNLKRGSMVYQFPLNGDRFGYSFSIEEGQQEIFVHSKVPMYSLWDTVLGRGIVGGKLVSGKIQGGMAAEMALSIMEGVPVKKIPVVTESPNRYMFDYNEMEEFGIRISDLPEDHILINEPVSVVEIGKQVFWIFLVSFAGAIVVISILTVNIVQRKKAENRLKRNEEMLRELTDNIREVFSVWDVSTKKLLFISKGYTEMFGRDTGSLREDPTSFLEGIHPEDRNKAEQIYHRIFVEKDSLEEFEIEFRYIGDGENIRWICVKGFPVIEEGGMVNRMALIAEDITERRLAEDREKRHREELYHADRLAFLGTIASSVAHDINNPNNYISLNSWNLEQAWKHTIPILEEYYREKGSFTIGKMAYPSVKGKILRCCQHIKKGSDRIKRIVEDLKTYSGSGQTETSKLIDINECVQTAVNLMEHEIQKKTDRFYLELDENLPLTRLNMQQVEQMVINILQNACDAISIKNKGIWIESKFLRDRNCICIKIRDEGVGIAKGNLDKIYEPFFTTRASEGGTGLGLAISHRIINEMNGKLEIESTVGLGTEVSLELPIIKNREMNPNVADEKQ